MARETIIKIWCDRCADQDLQNEGAELPPIQVGTKKARIAALCEPCKKAVYDPFMEMLDGAPPADQVGAISPKEPAAGKRPPINPENLKNGIACPLEGCRSVLKNRSSLSAHARSAHGLSLTDILDGEELLDVNGNRIAGPGEYQEPPDDMKRFDCLIDGCNASFEWNVNSGRPAHSMSVHYSGAHGLTAAMRAEVGNDPKKLNALARKAVGAKA